MSEKLPFWKSVKVTVFYIQWNVRDFIAGMLQRLAERIAP